MRTSAPLGVRLAQLVGRSAWAICALLQPLSGWCAEPASTPMPARYQIVIYGGTSAGVMAAVQARRMDKTVVLIEPGRHLGGLTSGGLGATDIGNKGAIGGLSREFYRQLGRHYANPEQWTRQTRAAYFQHKPPSSEDEMWTFEPHVAEKAFMEFASAAAVPVVLGERLDLKQGVQRQGGRIQSITMESGLRFDGEMFIDATYEGDLLPLAGVSFHVGREANSRYDETLNGVQLGSKKHQFGVRVDPYVEPGNPASGLLPGIHGGSPGEHGAGDHRVQAYNFRMCLTDDPNNRIPFPQPAGYDPLRYELLLRYIQGGVFDVLGNSQPMPNRKTDTNNNGAFSTDNIGMNYDYPNGDHATRERIFQDHVAYQQGLMWFLCNDSRVPVGIREQVSRWGLCRDEFSETGGWPHQLYVREARRMIGDHVMTQHNCQGRAVVDDSVGLAAYGMDSHNTQRYVLDGAASNEGDVQVHGFTPYPIAYRAIIPRRAECTNLLVPVCLSASHIAYGSIRMEPVFMVLGQSAATAAALALQQGVAVQDVDLGRLQQRLQQDGQILSWKSTGAASRRAEDLPGVAVDDSQAKLDGNWVSSQAMPGFVGRGYSHDENKNKGKLTAEFRAKLPHVGQYEVRVAYTTNANRATNVPVRIITAEGEKLVLIDQRQSPGEDGFKSLGKYTFKEEAVVVIGNAETDGHVIVDAVQWLPVKP